MDIVTRIDDDVKVVRMQDMKPMDGAHVERPPGIQQTQVDVLGTHSRANASQAQAMGAMKQAERERRTSQKSETVRREESTFSPLLLFCLHGHGRKQDRERANTTRIASRRIARW